MVRFYAPFVVLNCARFYLKYSEFIIFTFIKNLWKKNKPERNSKVKTTRSGSIVKNSLKENTNSTYPVKDTNITHCNRKGIDAHKYGILPKHIHKYALQIVEKLQRNGYEAYIVGGCLRDLLLGKDPKDFDVSTNASPEQVQELFGRQCRLVGRRFRLAHIMYGRNFIEVATFRANHEENHNDNQSKQSRAGMLLRDNVYGTLEEDAQRRDFTVNAFYYDPKNNKIYDFFDGLADLKAGKLRLIGDPQTRYKEDPVRMLRAIRFMAKLDMFLDHATEEPIKQLAPLLKNIPSARLFDESLKLLQSGYGVKTYHLLRKYNLFAQLFPALMPFFTQSADNYTEKMILTALKSTDERISDHLSINPAFLFAAFFWYPLREKVEILKNEGGLNNHDAYALAGNELLAALCLRLSAPRRHTAVIRDIWFLQLQFFKRQGHQPQRTFEHSKFRAAYDLLAMRAEIEGGEAIELTTWWYEYQQSSNSQRESLLNTIKDKHPKKKQSYYRNRRRRSRNNAKNTKNTTNNKSQKKANKHHDA